MRTFKHWTPIYIKNRVSVMRHVRRNPDEPWLTPHAVGLLKTLLRPTDVGFEFGSGRSTLWFANRLAKLHSVEQDAGWYAIVRDKIAAAGASNVELSLAEDTEGFTRACADVAPDSLDFALVDGGDRRACMAAVIPKVRVGGVLVLDNSEWYFVNPTRSPSRITQETADWQQVRQSLNGWRKIWTTSGVTDTSIFIRA